MLELVKRPLYDWHTRRRAQHTVAALEEDLRLGAPILLVHQMGRAGSMTTVQSLRGSHLARPVYHTHWLHPRNVEKRLAKFRDVPELRHPLNVRVARRISDALRREGPGRREWKLVTVFREPVARNISVFFLSIDVFVENFARRYASGALDNKQLLDIFLRDFPHEQPLSWFDMEVGEMFGVDVYQHPFAHEQGYQVIRSGRVDLLLVKLEGLNACYREAFTGFLGVDVPALAQTHVTEQDPSRPMYKDFVREAVLPREYLQWMYRSRFAEHFYGEAERAALTRKWSNIED